MTDFHADCTINLHVCARGEKRGQPALRSWSCSIQHPKHGRLVLASKAMGTVGKEEAERAALLFGLQQASRFLQEKVEVAATFPLEERLSKMKEARRKEREPVESEDAREVSPKEELARAWGRFRLRRVVRMQDSEAKLLSNEAEQALRRSR